MFSDMQRVLLDIGFLNPRNPSHIMRSIRRFLGRADLTPRDVQILRGIMTQMEWYAKEEKKKLTAVSCQLFPISIFIRTSPVSSLG